MSEKDKFMAITRKVYAEQAKWFLNGFWADLQGEAENVWKVAQKFIELDPKKKQGNELDEFWSHKFLETLGETLTVIQLREKLRKIDLDANGKMALMEYLIFKYSKTVTAVITAPQGDNTEEIDKCTKKLNAVNEALQELQVKLEEQKTALAAAQKRTAELLQAEEKAKRLESELAAALADLEKREAAVKAAEDEVRKAEDELRSAVADLTAQETAYKSKCDDLEAKSKDSAASQVARSKAANELAQLKQENPLPLRKAKLTQEAALRKVEKQRKDAEARTAEAKAATAAAAKARADAEEQRKAVEHQKQLALQAEAELAEITRQVEAKVAETQKAFEEAAAELEEAKKKAGDSHGSLWWLSRELTEAKKYMPKSKQ